MVNKERMLNKPNPVGETVTVGRAPTPARPARITIAPLWVEVARMYTRFAECGEYKACVQMTPEIVRMGRMADVLNDLLDELPAAKVQEVLALIKED